jgi:hypothetical protein
MSKADNFNKSLEDSPYDRGEATPAYGTISHAERTWLGAAHTRHEDMTNPSQAYTEHVHHDGSFHIQEASGLKNSLTIQDRSYTSGGKGTNVDGNSAQYSQENHLHSTKGDVGSSSGGDSYKGHGGKELGGSQEGGYHHSEGDSFHTSNGNVVHSHSGDLHTNHEGDKISSITGNDYHMVNGEYGLNIQSGNFDVMVNSGKAQVSAAQDIVIKSNTKITLKVGSSTIVISPTDITMTVGSSSYKLTGSDITEQASGTVNISGGSGTKIQGGGSASPPTTFS